VCSFGQQHEAKGRALGHPGFEPGARCISMCTVHGNGEKNLLGSKKKKSGQSSSERDLLCSAKKKWPEQ